MKKYLFIILFSFVGYTSSYASFPVHNNTEAVVVIDSPNTVPVLEDTPFANWSLALGLLWFPLLLGAIIFLWDGPEENALFFIVASIASFIGAIVTGIISLTRKERGVWKAIIGLSLTLGIILLGILSEAIDWHL